VLISMNLAPEVPDRLLSLVPQKMRLVGLEALQVGAGPLWVCEGGFDALALVAAGVPPLLGVVAK